ncbi:MAG: hypothetical protein ACJ72N_28105 [Labedaea sp.]
MKEPQPRSVPCRDALGRVHVSTVALNGDAAVLTVAAGEIVRCPAPELSALIDTCGAARDELRRREA